MNTKILSIIILSFNYFLFIKCVKIDDIIKKLKIKEKNFTVNKSFIEQKKQNDEELIDISDEYERINPENPDYFYIPIFCSSDIHGHFYGEELEIDKSFLRRDLNVGFSWGEKRKIEVLQIRLLNPSIIILDEIDSGLDVNAVKQVSTLLKKINNTENTFIIITHLFEMLEGLPIEQVLIIENWKLKETWNKNGRHSVFDSNTGIDNTQCWSRARASFINGDNSSDYRVYCFCDH